MVNLLNPMLMGPAQALQQPPAMPAPLAAPSRFAGAGQRLRGMLAPEIALPMAGAMMMGRTPGESFGNAFMIGGQAMGEQKMKEEEQRQQNATLAYLQKSRPDLAAAVSAGMPMQMAWQHAFNKGGADGASYSKTPVYMTDDSGNTVLGTIGDDGSFKKIDTGGLSVASGIDKIDAGTKWLLYDKRTGEKVGEQPKETYQEAFEKGAGAEAGRAQGEAQASYASMMSKMPGLERVVSQLDELSERATYTLSGQIIDFGMRQAGMEPRDAAIARAKYIAIVDNQILPLLRDTFGAAFTVKEGETLRATLGDADKSPKEKQEVLRAFIEQKRRDVTALAVQAGQAPQPPADDNRPAPVGVEPDLWQYMTPEERALWK